MTIHKAKANDYASVNIDSIIEYIFGYAMRVNKAVREGRYNGKLQQANKIQLNTIAAELETVCKRLDYILEGKY